MTAAAPDLPAAPPSGRPLVVTAAEGLLDDLLRLLAASGSSAEVATGGPALRRAHRQAPVVLVGADAVTTAPVRGLPRRPGVVVVSHGPLPAAAWAAAVECGAERVAVLPDDEPWLMARIARAGQGQVQRGWLLAVGGGCGGAGASTLAVALARTASDRGDDVVLVDADALGGGLDLLVGAEAEPGLRWPELAGLRGRVAGEPVVAALPERGGVRLLTAGRNAAGPVPVEAMTAVLAGVRGAGHPVVVDLPRALPGAEAVLAEADLAVLVVPAWLRASCAARLLLTPGADAVPSAWAAAHLVVRQVPGGLSAAEVAGVVGRPVLAEIGHDRSAPTRAERGEPPATGPRSVWGSVARRLLDELVTEGALRG